MMTLRFSSMLAVGLGVLVLAVMSSATVAEAQAFGYGCEICPANWPNLPILNNNCGGPNQSPIAFSDGDARSREAVLQVNYGDNVALQEEELSTNIEWKDEPPGDNTVRFEGTTYAFVQFHFHSTAEHVINGERSDLEMHFVHQASDGSLLVLAVFIEAGDANDEFAPIITSLEISGEQEIAVDLRALLPGRLASFRYQGSTTTPPCTGGVQWILLKQQVELSAAQIEMIRDAIRELNDGFDNNRTVQNRERRVINTVKPDDDDD
jgi:carbonic anhydrase